MGRSSNESSSRIAEQQLEILARTFGHLLDEAGLSVAGVSDADSVTLDALDASICEELRHPEGFGNLNLKVETEHGLIVTSQAEAHMVLTARPVLLERLAVVRRAAALLRDGGVPPSENVTPAARSGLVVVFVHGLGSSSIKTWGGTPSFPEIVADFDGVEHFFYEYPTKKVRFHPFGLVPPPIQTLAAGLESFLQLRVGHKDVVLVCHSMGGVVAKKMLIEAHQAGRAPGVRLMLLYGTPNNGAELAAVAEHVGFRNRQIRQLAPDSDFMFELNEDWHQLEMAEGIRTHYVVGGADRAVSTRSARGSWGETEVTVSIGATHSGLVAPATAEDLGALRLRLELGELANLEIPVSPTEVPVTSAEAPKPGQPPGTPTSVDRMTPSQEEPGRERLALALTAAGGAFLASTQGLSAIDPDARGIRLILASLVLGVGVGFLAYAVRELSRRRPSALPGVIGAVAVAVAVGLAVSAEPSGEAQASIDPVRQTTLAPSPSVTTTSTSSTTSTTLSLPTTEAPNSEDFVLDVSSSGQFGIRFAEVDNERYLLGIRGTQLVPWGPTQARVRVATVTISDTAEGGQPSVYQMASGDQERFGSNCEFLMTALDATLFTITLRVQRVADETTGCGSSTISDLECNPDAWREAAETLIADRGLAGSWVDPDGDCLHSNYESNAAGKPFCVETPDCDDDGTPDGFDRDYDSGGGRLPSLEEQLPYFAN